MTLRRAYCLLAAFYSLLLVIGIVAVLMGGGTPLAAVYLVVGFFAVLGLWGTSLQRRVMSPRMWRPLGVVLAIGGGGQLVAVVMVPVSGVTLTWMLVSSIFALLLAVMLYHYGNRDQPLWATAEEQNAASRLRAMLHQQTALTATHREGERENHANVFKVGNEYEANITRHSPEGQEAFSERFHHPESLVFFLEKFASISVNDFQRSVSSQQ
jgi:membrane-bound ClpP family serine protease